MILIENDKTKEVKQNHYDALHPYALSMIDFYLAFFNSVGDNSYSLPDGKGTIAILETRSHKTLTASVSHLFELKSEKDKVTKDILKEVLSTGKSTTLSLKISSAEAKILFKLFTDIKNKLDVILKGSAIDLQDIVDKKHFTFPKGSKELICVGWVFNYERFRKDGFKLNGKKWDAYSLTSDLELSVCPYCNRNWIVTVTDEDDVSDKTKKIVNPQLDHFFSQEEQPQFAVSFYNLIPSCEACNARLKKRIQFNTHDYLHPYLLGYGIESTFETTPKDLDSTHGKGSNYIVKLTHTKKINAKLKTKIENNHKVFQIDTIYEQHGDVVADLYRKKFLFSNDYVSVLQNAIGSYKFKPEEIYRIAFGNYYFEKDFSKRPFAKLTKDIIANLGLFQNE